LVYSRPSATQILFSVNSSVPVVQCAPHGRFPATFRNLTSYFHFRFALRLPGDARSELAILSTATIDLVPSLSCCNTGSTQQAAAGTVRRMQTSQDLNIVFTRGPQDAMVNITIKYDTDFCVAPAIPSCSDIVTFPVTNLDYSGSPSSTLQELDILYPQATSACRETVRRLACLNVAYPCTGASAPSVCREQCASDLVSACASLNFPPYFVTSACKYFAACPEAPSSTGTGGGAPQTGGGSGVPSTQGGTNTAPSGATTKSPGSTNTSAAISSIASSMFALLAVATAVLLL
jgi:hypothetical protein